MNGDLVHFTAVKYQQNGLGAQDIAHHNGRLPEIEIIQFSKDDNKFM